MSYRCSICQAPVAEGSTCMCGTDPKRYEIPAQIHDRLKQRVATPQLPAATPAVEEREELAKFFADWYMAPIYREHQEMADAFLKQFPGFIKPREVPREEVLSAMKNTCPHIFKDSYFGGEPNCCEKKCICEHAASALSAAGMAVVWKEGNK